MSSLYERDGRRILFVHIPKAGGTSVRRMLVQEGWKKIEDPETPENLKNEIPGSRRSKHQHKALRDLWSNRGWNCAFSIVRNPYERFFSQMKHIAVARKNAGFDQGHGNVPTSAGVLESFKNIYDNLIPKLGIGFDDNHFRPQSDFIEDGVSCYRLEDQLSEMVDFLRKNKIISNNILLPHLNESIENSPNVIVSWPLNKELHSKFLNLYWDDFENFGYSREVPTYGISVNWNKYN